MGWEVRNVVVKRKGLRAFRMLSLTLICAAFILLASSSLVLAQDGQYTLDIEITNIINIPEKDLPETGGPPLLAILVSTVAGAGLLTAVVKRRN